MHEEVLDYLQIDKQGERQDEYYIIEFDNFDEFYDIYNRLSNDDNIETDREGNFTVDGNISPYIFIYDNDIEIQLLGNIDTDEYQLKIKEE